MSPIWDATGHPLELEPPPGRIVSLVPSLTELVVALGAGSKLVGVTRYCIEASDAVGRLPRVGGTKNPDLEKVRQLEPELVLANMEENRREDVEQLRAMGLRVMVTYPRSVADVVVVVRAVARMVRAYATGQELIASIERTLGSRSAEKVKVFCPIWKNPWMSFGSDTYAHDALRLAGGSNVCTGAGNRYPTIDLDFVAEQNPEVILLPDEPYRFAPRDLRDMMPLSETTAIRSGRVYFVNGKALTWFGARTAGAVKYLRRFLHTA